MDLIWPRIGIVLDGVGALLLAAEVLGAERAGAMEAKVRRGLARYGSPATVWRAVVEREWVLLVPMAVPLLLLVGAFFAWLFPGSPLAQALNHPWVDASLGAVESASSGVARWVYSHVPWWIKPLGFVLAILYLVLDHFGSDLVAPAAYGAAILLAPLAYAIALNLVVFYATAYVALMLVYLPFVPIHVAMFAARRWGLKGGIPLLGILFLFIGLALQFLGTL